MLQHHKQNRGNLSVLEYKSLNFNPKRMYYITGVPAGEIRGKHGHIQDKQYLICIKGEIEIKTIDKFSNENTTILKEGEIFFINNMTWGEQKYITGSEILLVLCSTNYNADDYIYDLNEITKNSI